MTKNQNYNKIIQIKTESFKSEVGDKSLNEEQKRIFAAFVFRRAKPYNFAITDAYGNTVRFSLYTNKTDDGVLHILSKHYKGSVGNVTATEILNFCDVIRFGSMSFNGKSIAYTWRKNGKTFKLIVALKHVKDGGNVLKSFYSDRKKP